MTDVASLSKELDEPDWLLKERLECARLAKPDFSIPEPKKLRIRSKNVKIRSLAEMLEKDAKFTKKIFQERRLKTQNPYAAYLNSRFIECNFMFVDKGKKAELDILADSALSMNFIFLGEGSSLRLSTTTISDSMNIIQTKAEENARLDAGFLKHKKGFAYNGHVGTAGTGSTINSASFWSGNGFCDNKAELHGAGSKTLRIEFASAGDNESIAVNSGVVHAANNTQSEVIMRGVAQDSSNTLFKGHVNVEKNGRGSKSHLAQHVLLLDKNARAEAHPVLEIKNNSVECSHSAAVRQLEEEKLFYLMTRGLTRKSARATMIIGFLRSAINKIEDKELRNMFRPPFLQD